MERKETKFWSNIRAATSCFKGKYKVHWTRIENMVDSGTPDTWGVCNGVYFPVELKCTEHGANVYLRPAQVNWMLMHLSAGGTPWLMVNWDSDYYVLKFTTELYKLLEVVQNGKYYMFCMKQAVLEDLVQYATGKPYRYIGIIETLIGEKHA